MSTAQHPAYVHTSIRYFYSIAFEAITFVRADQKARFTPRPDGQPGGGIKWDPEQRGFKTSFIAIVFSGTFIEAALHQLIASRKGIEEAKRADKWTYEKKLQLLGCNDASLFAHCREYSAARREIVHEKAYLEDGNLRIAQHEADRAFELVEKIVDLFDLRTKLSLPTASPGAGGRDRKEEVRMPTVDLKAPTAELVKLTAEIMAEVEELGDSNDGKRITLLLTAGILRDQLHRRAERSRTITIMVLTAVTAALTLVVAMTSFRDLWRQVRWLLDQVHAVEIALLKFIAR